MDTTDTSSPAVPPPPTPEQTPAVPPLPPTTKRDELLGRVAAGAAVPPPLPPVAEKAPLGDPSWWRLRRGIPFIALLLVAVAADYFCPFLCEGTSAVGFGTALGTLLFIAALVLLRKDYSCGERIFLILFALITAAAQAFSGSVLSWVAVPVVCLFMLILPKECDTPDERARTWWGFWLARRPDGSKAKAISRGCMPLVISIAVGLALFFAFLAIFASGNPVVKQAWELICEYWNKLLTFLHLDMTIWAHALVWCIGVAGFGVFTFRRNRVLRTPAPKQETAAGKTLLPHLPGFMLAGINAAFAIATSTDIMYLWFRRIPEGISQTDYLYHGAQAIIIASVLAAGLLLILFRSRGTARQSYVARLLGYLLVFQTALLAVSVFMRLFFQIDAHGFTGQRVLACECMLGGVIGIVLLLSYLLGGCFLKHLKLGIGALVLLLFAGNIQPPSSLAGELNMCFIDSHPQWKFETSDFLFPHTCFNAEGCLPFADKYMETTNSYQIAQLIAAAESHTARHEGNWRSLTVNAIRFRELADVVTKREKEKLTVAKEEEQKNWEAVRQQFEAAQNPEDESEAGEQGETPDAAPGEDAQ